MNQITGDISLPGLMQAFRGKIAITWLIVLVENVFLAFIPLLIGFAIDGLMAGRMDELITMGGAMVALGIVAVSRRLYDTRVYGTMRLQLGLTVHQKSAHIKISSQNARLGMSGELVDFLEHEAPELITAIIQILVSLGILFTFEVGLGISAILVVTGMIGLYSLFHGRFYRMNARLNAQVEQQVDVLTTKSPLGLFKHLRALRQSQVAISDSEAYLYGGIFLMQIVFILYNLFLGAQLPEITAGKIFSIATYSWEYVEAALMLPIALQSWSRLSEIMARINGTGIPESSD